MLLAGRGHMRNKCGHINDTLGHDAGGKCLQMVGTCVKETMGEGSNRWCENGSI